jgi:tetratricopeptide (TPR) repeat protein
MSYLHPFKYSIVLLLLLLTVPLFADEGHEGHEHELTEQQVGTVHFPISCAPSVQKEFERGVALLHSFAFETAEAAFRHVVKDDPQCAMAHWGIAMTFWRWGGPDVARRKQAWNEVQTAESLHAKTQREIDYIDALAKLYAQPEEDRKDRLEVYSQAMGQLHDRYPKDYEAAAFYAWSLIAAEPDPDPGYSYRKKAAAVLEPLFKLEPDHPGVAHYLIHAYDKPGLAELGLPAARRYAKIAPAAPHALHMPSHIFARLGLWQEDIDSNLASIAASRNAVSMHMGDAGHQFHAMDFLIYAYVQSGRDFEALRVIDEVKTLPKMNDMYGMGYDPRIPAQVGFSSFYVLSMHDWKAAATLPEVPGTPEFDLSVVPMTRAIGAAHMGDIPTAEANIAKIEEVHATFVKQKNDWVAKGVEDEVKLATAWLDHAKGQNEEAISILQELTKNEEGIFEAGDDPPAHEMIADMLMDMNQPQKALTEYEAELKLSPNRFNSLYGAAHAAELSGQPQKADDYYNQLVKNCAGGDSLRPELVRAKEMVQKSAATQ